MRDTVKVYLRNISSPFAIEDSSTVVFDSVSFSPAYSSMLIQEHIICKSNTEML
ncbi:MAG: hypothetical protein IPL67_19445 [Ignavibacteria bacterium]|nr:hypothetical protein [Ignavibacteria bacterium]